MKLKNLLIIVGISFVRVDCTCTQVEALQRELEALKAKVNRIQGPPVLEDGRLLVFRVTSESGVKSWQAYTNRGYGDHFDPLACPGPYRSRFLDSWPSDIIDTVRVSVEERGREVAYVEFDGRGSDYLNWFSKSRVISSTWTDLRTEPQNYFSIKGDDETRPTHTSQRRFYINRNYAGCPADNGWLVVLDSSDVCTWSNITSYPIILYSKRTTNVNWNSRGDVGVADALTVTVKLRNGQGQCYR